MQPATRTTLASLLRSMREAAGFSQEELAERAHLSSHAISALERGTRTRPYPHTIRVLADALAASAEQRAALIAAVPPRRSARDAPIDAAAGQNRRVPVPATTLVGRDEDVRHVVGLVHDPAVRIVTLTGTGGVGKTRVSLAVAAEVEPAFTQGVFFVELAPVSAADDVLAAIADSVGAGTSDDRDSSAEVVDHLSGRQVLLVLDNFEHVLDAAPLVSRLVEAAPEVTVLVSSRAALRVRGETEVAVAPLPVAAPGADASVVATSPAAALFLERARAVSPGLLLTDDNAAEVAEICRRLAGIPLALELAAAHTRLLDPARLLVRLDEAALDGARDLPARQRTMTAALDWSYGLLSDEEQALLRLLAVFSRGFRLDDVEAVASRLPLVNPASVLGLLRVLSEHSLVVTDRGDGEPRFHLLEPVAQYAWTRLCADSVELQHASTSHTQHFLALAEQAAPEYQRAEQVTWLARIDAEHANLSAAFERCLADGAYDVAAHLGWALWLYWWLRGHLTQGRRVMEVTLAHELPDDVLPRAELAAATMAFAMDDIATSRRWWQSAWDHSRGDDDPVVQANAVAGVGLTALASGDLAEAEERFRTAAPLADAGGQRGEWTAALKHIWLGTVTLLRGHIDDAAAHVEHGLVSARQRGDRLTTYVALYNLSQIAVAGHDVTVAREHLVEGISLSMETGDVANLAYFLEALAVVEATGGSHSRVPLLVGAAQGIREDIGAWGYGYYRPDVTAGKHAVDSARKHLGADRYDDALDVGRRLSAVEAVDLALGRRAREA